MNQLIRRMLVLNLPLFLAVSLSLIGLSLLGQVTLPIARALSPTTGAGALLEPDNSGQAYPGNIITYTHVLTNTGEEADSYTPIVSSGAEFPVTVSHFAAVVIESEQHRTVIQPWRLFLPVLVKPAEWQPAGSQWPDGVGARSLAVCAGNSELMIAGTINNGVWLRNAANWSKAPNVPDGYSVTNAVINQACDAVYVSLFNQGVWQGSWSESVWTWTQAGGSEVAEARALALVGDTLYVGGAFGIHYWQNGAWQATNISNAGSQPIMHMSAANPLTNSGPAYAVQWQSSKILRSTAAPAVWEELIVAELPDVFTRVVYGTSAGIQFVGTDNQALHLQNGAWQPLNVSAGLRSAVISGNRSYLGFAAGAGVYELYDGHLTPLTNGWTAAPEFVYELRLVGGKLYAATMNGVWVYNVSKDGE
jgi:hypothetical protein